jgi:hypothetical protein
VTCHAGGGRLGIVVAQGVDQRQVIVHLAVPLADPVADNLSKRVGHARVAEDFVRQVFVSSAPRHEVMEPAVE